MPSDLQIEIIGHATQPEMRFTSDGQPVATFSVAVNERDKDGKDKPPTWFRIHVWGKQGETVNEYVHKGMLVLVRGYRVEARAYADKATGEPRASMDVTASRVLFLSGKAKDAAEPGAPF